MECSFGDSAKIFLPETQNILAQCPKVGKVLFLPETCPLECSTGREECLTDEPAVFLQIRDSSGKPPQIIKLYLLPKNFLSLFSSGNIDFVFDTHVENFCFKSGTSSFKIRKGSQNYFFRKKTRLSQSFSLDIWNAVLTTPPKMFQKETSNFSLTAHKSKRSGFGQILPSKCSAPLDA